MPRRRGRGGRWVGRALVALCLLFMAPLARADQPPAAGSHDSAQPIEITADTLEVQQDKKIAIFRGNVDAVQGDLLLRADTLVVHYRERQAGAASGEAPPAISRIEAEGDVFVSSPTETAEGKHGVYDIDAERIVLTGSVVLTRGENVIKGERLELDLASGQSRVIGTPGGRQRVRGLFVPERKGAAAPARPPKPPRR